MKGINLFSDKFINRYKRNSLFTQYFFHFTLVVLIPVILLCVLTYTVFTKTLNQEITDKIALKAMQTAVAYDDVFEKTNTLYNQMNVSEDITNLFRLESLDDIGQYIQNPIKNIKKITDHYSGTVHGLKSIYLYNQKTDYVFAFYGNSGNYLDNFSDKMWYEKYIDNNRENYIEFTSDENNIIFCYNIQKSLPNPGILTIIFDNSIINHSYIDPKEDESIYFSFEKDNSASQPTQILNVSGSMHEVSVSLSNYPAVLHFRTAAKSLKKAQRLYYFAYLPLIIFAILFSLLLAYLYSKKQYNSIIKLVSAIEEPTIFKEEKNASEISYLITVSQSLHTRISDLEDTLAKKIANLQKAQSLALQNQITPHFIINTLNLINTSIINEVGHDTESVKLTHLLSKIISSSTDNTKYIIPFTEELDAIKNYVHLMLIKYDFDFDVSWNISSEVYQLYTIKHIIQPILENAIEHGIKPLFNTKSCTININVFIENKNNFVIELSNNGVPISPDKLTELDNSLKSDDIYTRCNIGLSNVAYRLRLIWGEKYGIKIKSDLEKTTVTLSQPIIKKETYEEI